MGLNHWIFPGSFMNLSSSSFIFHLFFIFLLLFFFLYVFSFWFWLLNYCRFQCLGSSVVSVLVFFLFTPLVHFSFAVVLVHLHNWLSWTTQHPWWSSRCWNAAASWQDWGWATHQVFPRPTNTNLLGTHLLKSFSVCQRHCDAAVGEEPLLVLLLQEQDHLLQCLHERGRLSFFFFPSFYSTSVWK